MSYYDQAQHNVTLQENALWSDTVSKLSYRVDLDMDYDATTNFDGTWRYFDPIAIDERVGPLLHDTTITNGLDTDIHYFFAYCYSVLQGIEKIVRCLPNC